MHLAAAGGSEGGEQQEADEEQQKAADAPPPALSDHEAAQLRAGLNQVLLLSDKLAHKTTVFGRRCRTTTSPNCAPA